MHENHPWHNTNDIIDDVNDFVSNFVNENNNIKINLMGHSLGNCLCATYINRHPECINNFFCVEGQIFFHRSLKIYRDFYVSPFELPIDDLLTVPLFHRDLTYVQYFMYKKLSIDKVE